MVGKGGNSLSIVHSLRNGVISEDGCVAVPLRSPAPDGAGRSVEMGGVEPPSGKVLKAGLQALDFWSNWL